MKLFELDKTHDKIIEEINLINPITLRMSITEIN